MTTENGLTVAEIARQTQLPLAVVKATVAETEKPEAKNESFPTLVSHIAFGKKFLLINEHGERVHFLVPEKIERQYRFGKI